MEQPDPPPPSPAARAAASSAVFEIGELLEEILLRLDIPAFLVLASQVSWSWRSRATDPVFLRRFRARLALRPRPLGFYVGFVCHSPHDRTNFVLMSQRPELAAVVARARFGRFDHQPEPGQDSHALDCRNGRVLLNLLRYCDGPYAVLTPLERDEAPAMAVLPPPLTPSLVDDVVLRLLPEDGGDGPPCLVVRISLLPDQPGAMVRLSRMQDGLWVDRICSATGLIAPLGYPLEQLLVRDKLYMLSTNGYILRLDLASMRFLVIKLPDGVELVTMDNAGADGQVLSRADDCGSGFYFIQAKANQLSVWLCKINGDNGSMWVLEDTISLYKAFGDFAKLIWKSDDESDDIFHVHGAGDNAEFVFLVDRDSFAKHIFYLNIRTRKVEVVYYKDFEQHGEVLDICPFMMV